MIGLLLPKHRVLSMENMRMGSARSPLWGKANFLETILVGGVILLCLLGFVDLHLQVFTQRLT